MLLFCLYKVCAGCSKPPAKPHTRHYMHGFLFRLHLFTRHTCSCHSYTGFPPLVDIPAERKCGATLHRRSTVTLVPARLHDLGHWLSTQQRFARVLLSRVTSPLSSLVRFSTGWSSACTTWISPIRIANGLRSCLPIFSPKLTENADCRDVFRRPHGHSLWRVQRSIIQQTVSWRHNTKTLAAANGSISLSVRSSSPHGWQRWYRAATSTDRELS